MSRRDRVAEAIRKEASVIIHDELKDPRLGFVTITAVEMASDLRFAKIFFSVLGSEEERRKTKEALDSALGFIRKLIAERINLRLAPEIIFREDESIEQSIRIEQVLNEIKELSAPAPAFDKKPKSKARKGKPRPSYKARDGVKNRKEGRGEPKRSRRLHKKK